MERKQGWFLLEILVKNTRNKKVWTFPCFQWLSLFESDCQIKRQLQPNSGTSKPHKSGWFEILFFRNVFFSSLEARVCVSFLNCHILVKREVENKS